MNKKQAGIIVTLLALIVCAGILAAKVNGPLGVASDFGNPSDVFNLSNDSKNTSNSDYFVTAKVDRENTDGKLVAAYKTMIEDKNVTQASKTEAEKEILTITKAMGYENTIESTLKGKGFDDVICFIEDNKVRIIVKAKEVSDKDRKIIQDVVVSVSKIKTIEIEARQ